MSTTIGCDILLGQNFLLKYAPFTQYIDKYMFTTPCAHKIFTPKINKAVTIAYREINHQSSSTQRGGCWSTEKFKPVTVLKMTTENRIEKLKKEISETYSENPLEKWNTDKVKAKIELINSGTIVRVKPMKYSVDDQKEFKDQIKKLLEAKLIRPSKSPHSSPTFMVRKHSEIKRGKARMVINYKKLNEVTKFDRYYLPNKDTLIKQVQNKKIFSKFDCKSGFWQIMLTEESKPLTAFSTPNPLGQYEWNVMPFGLKNAPQIFQRRMDEVIKPITHFCIAYVDDLLIHSNNIDEHIEHLEKFCYIMKKHGITLSQKKAEIAKTEIEFLGLFIKEGELQLQSHIGEKLQEFPEKIKDKK